MFKMAFRLRPLAFIIDFILTAPAGSQWRGVLGRIGSRNAILFDGRSLHSNCTGGEVELAYSNTINHNYLTKHLYSSVDWRWKVQIRRSAWQQPLGRK